MRRPFFRACSIALLFSCSFSCHAASLAAQEKSVKPGINKSFEDPDPRTFIERFEREGRDVYDNRERIVTLCNLKSGMTVADIGAGTGLYTRLFAPIVGDEGKVYAVDIAKNFVEHILKSCDAKQIKNVEGVVCKPDSVELPKDSIDRAFICDVYHHFEYPDKTMRSLHKAMKDDGELVVIDFKRIEGESSEWILGHVRAGQEVFTKEILAAGFKKIGEEKFMKNTYFLRFAKARKSE